MKKHIFRTLAVMLFVCLGMAVFAACDPKQEADTFTVTYVAGEGTGTAPATEKHAEGETFTVAENSFTFEGHTFKAWNDGTKDVAAGETYTMPAKDVTFTAKWTAQATAEKVTVTFSLGDNTTGTVPAAQEVDKGAKVTLPEAPAWAGHIFLGWKVGTDETLKKAGDKITASADVTVTAQWAEEVTVTYSLGDGVTGDAPAPQTVAKNGEVTLPAAPTRTGYDFAGWKVGNEVKNVGEKITVTASMTVTAQWEAAITGYWTATDVDPSTFGGSGANVSIEVAVKRLGNEAYVVLKVTQGDASWMYAVYAEKGASAWECDLGTMTVEDGKLKVTLTVFDGTNLELSGRTDLGSDLTATGTYSATVGEAEHYLDLDQYGYDGGDGYMNDAEFVSVGKYLAVFEYDEEEESSECAVVLVAGQEGALEAYNMGGHVGTFATCEARAQTVSYSVFKLEQEGEEVYLTVEGVYSGFTPTGLRTLQEDTDIEHYNISVFLKGGASGNTYTVYPNPNNADGVALINRILTIGQGKISARFTVTDLPLDGDTGYGVASQNDGHGDLKYGSTPADYEIKLGSMVYTLKGSSGNVVVLKVEAYNHATDWTGVTTTPTAITLTLNDAKDKVLLTISGTYTGTTKEHMQELLSQKYNNYNIIFFWGATAGTETPDLVVTVDETTWKIVVDVTALKDDVAHAICTQKEGFNPRKSGSGTEFQFAGIEDTTVRVGDKCYTLMEVGGSYGHNTLSTGDPATVTYGLNGWTDGTAPASATVAKGANVTLADLSGERTGFIFKGWKVGTDDKGGDVIQQPGSRLNVTADVTVTAVWAEAVTLTYDLGEIGDEALETPAPVTVEKGGKVTLVQAPQRDGYTFKGWRVGEDLKQANEQVELSQNITATAEWMKGSVNGIWEGTIFGCPGSLYLSEAPGGLYVIVSIESSDFGIMRRAFFLATQEDGSWASDSMAVRFTDDGLVMTDEDIDPITLTEYKKFGAEDTVEIPSGAYSYRAAEAQQDAFYVDFDYKAIDNGNGYLVDAEFATVGKFVIALIEQEQGRKYGPVFEVANGKLNVSNGEPTGSQDVLMDLTATTARAQTALRFSTITLTVDSENSKVYLTATSNVYNNFTPNHILALFAGSEDNELDPDSPSKKGIGFNPYIYGGSAVQGTNWTVTVTMAEGIITAKFDVTNLPDGSYIFLANNSGYSDTKFGSSTAGTQTLNEKEFKTRSGDYGNATLDVRKITNNVIIATKIAIGLDNEDAGQATKVLLTVSGTYSGADYTKETVQAMLEQQYSGNPVIFFWGPKTSIQVGKDYVVTVGEGTWSITFDITDMKIEEDNQGSAICTGLNGPGKLNNRGASDTEFQVQDIEEKTVTLNGKSYRLVKAGLYGHNTIYVTSAAE